MELTNRRFGELVDLLIQRLNSDLSLDKLCRKYEVTLSDGSEYVIYNKEQQLEAVKEDIYEEVSYFNPGFLEQRTDIPREVFEALEGHNDAVVKIIESTCGLDTFAEECIEISGAGQLLAHYDEVEIGLDDDYSAFRIN